MVKRILKLIGIIICVFIVAVGGLLAYLTAAEYKPEPTEPVDIIATGGDATADAADADAAGADDTAADAALPRVKDGQSLSVMTWNLGYGALGDNADFFMDGGSSVKTADEQRVHENMDAIKSHLSEADPDIVLLQEIDQGSSRSSDIDEVSDLREFYGAGSSAFANNFKAFVPYPMPPIGKVDSGILTLSKASITDASRVSLPCPFSWPLRTANLKRCLLVSRVPVSGAKDRQLVIVNLHLEAYDSGEGKIAQTRTLLDILNEERSKGNYVIAGGDFNQTFSNVDASRYPELEGMWMCGKIDAADFGDGWSLLMDSSVPTCRSLDRPYEGLSESAKSPENFQYYMIDGFIVSDNIKVESVQTHDQGFVNTDHNPVMMKITLGE